MDLRIVTLDHPRSLASREPPRTKWEFDLRSFVLGALAVAIILGLLGGLTIPALAHDNPARASEHQQVTGKLDPPVIARVALLSPIETTPIDQVAEPVWAVPLTDEELATLLEACEGNHIAPEIAPGLIQVESSFDPDAVNPKSGCYGYCQLSPCYFPSGLSPVDNIRTGIEYLAYQLERYDGDMVAALTAYNAGYDTGSRTYADKVVAASSTFSEGR